MLNINFNRKPSTVITVVVKHPAPAVFTWKAQFGEILLYWHEDSQRFRNGIYMGTWAERSGSNESSPFLHETMPYCGKEENQVYRCFILDLADGFSDYADSDLIGELDAFGIDWAHEQNSIIREREAMERLEAFGEVEAVA